MDIFNPGQYVESGSLYEHAASLARVLRPSGSCRGVKSAKLLDRRLSEIGRYRTALQKRAAEMSSVPPAWEWLLDNWYMVQREALCARAALSAAGSLRRSGDAPLIIGLCRALAAAGDGSVTEERCRIFLDGFQSVTVLRRAELDLFTAAVRFALISAIAELCGKLPDSGEAARLTGAMESLFSSLRLFSVLDGDKLLNGADVTDAVLSADPTGDYVRMDRASKLQYLRRVERLSRREGLEEHVYASRLIKRAKGEGRHVGFYLFGGSGQAGARLYIGGSIMLSLFLSLLAAFTLDSPWAALLLLLPVSELVKSFLDFVLLHIVRPARLPRMNMEKGIPPEGRSICLISVLLTDQQCARKMADRLEELRQACKREGPELLFGLLADLPEADSRELPGDRELLETAAAAVNGLNRKYGGGFYLFTRERSFDGQRWSGSERKMGAIKELARLLCQKPSALRVTGEKDALNGVRYIITLDSDTRPYPGSVGELVGAMLHPLSKPVIDEKRRVVVKGHGIIQPRIDTELSSANATDFALIFAGAGGSDPYGGLCGELYMDAFQSGGFSGKGIIDVEAYMQCAAERFPKGRVLSHDALEGACLRGGFMGDAEFSDAFPSGPLAYYKRLHRWIRGDWQNLPWVFCRDFAPIERFRLLDSLRRGLLPPMTLAAILAGFFLPAGGLAVAAWAALLAVLSRLFISLAEGGARRRERVRLRRYTRLLTGVGGAIVQSFIRLWLLPWEAWVCLSAICLALWRMLISGKNLLQWQTAAQSETSRGGLGACFRAMWQAVLTGLLLLFFSPAIIGRSAGLMWLLSPLATAALALPAHRDTELSAADRALILKAAAENYRYFTHFSTAEDNWLPPDNFQEQPPVGLAHRTSPTNIGLALAAAVAAMDMELISPSQAAESIERTVSTIERLPKLMGHLYNWYDTRSLTPLSPAFISTVDSGNLCAALICVSRAMAAIGRDELAERLSRISDGMDFSPLYDRERELFYICYDSALGKGSGGWYDLMASEAMLTSYLAVARGEAPVKHWRRLSRAQLQKDGFRGLASWTGTMFEYLMPELFLPFYRGSLLYESGKFCLYAQKRQVFAGKPWGISESAFFSLDPSMNYRYKANGCAALALKRGQEKDMVVSPYSSFLALSLEPHAAAMNLRRLQRFGAVGRFGFMEALDFSPSRCRSDSGEKVRCYMAHHIGMSVIAAANALCGGSIRRRFMADSAMGAYKLLLQERLPDSGQVIRRDMAEVPEKPERGPSGLWQIRGGAGDPRQCCLLSNGAYNLFSSSRGESHGALGRICVYGSPRLDAPGLHVSVSKNGGPFTPIFSGPTAAWELGEDQARWSYEQDGLSLEMSLSAAAGDWGELRRFSLMSRQDTSLKLRLEFQPVLAEHSDHTNHSSFWKLGIKAEREENALILRRLRRGAMSGLWLCAAWDRPALFSPQKGAEGPWLTDPFVSAELSLELKAGVKTAASFSLCLGRSRSEALEGARRIPLSEDRGVMTGAAAAHLGMGPADIGFAMGLLPGLMAPLSGARPKKELWPLGVSGDLPIICCEGSALECLPLLRAFCLLKSCGMELDLVYFTDEQGEYRRPLYRRLSEFLAPLGLEALIGARGGLHFAPYSAKELVESRAGFAVGVEKPRLQSLLLPRLSDERRPDRIPLHSWNGLVFEYYVNHSLPPRQWQQLLSNGRLGAIMSDCGPGALWFDNARELRISPPNEDIRAAQGRELLWLDAGGELISLFAANDSLPCQISYSPGLALWEKDLGGRRVSTCAFIPVGIDARVLIIKGAGGLRLSWALPLVLGSSDGACIKWSAEGRLFRARNPEACYEDLEFLACASSFCSIRGDFSPPAMLMNLVAEDVCVLTCGCCGQEELFELCKPGTAITALEHVKSRWQSLLGRFRMDSPSGPLDRYMDHWALYQTIACRLEGRSSLYQSGGAFGFRDQLQDSVNLLLISPAYAKERILDCCRHQYEEGDVMHWWHACPQGDRGIRSRCSDDLLWLCWALTEYVAATGDMGICELEINYVNSPPLKPEERDRYEAPGPSPISATVLEHALSAIDCCERRGFGPHGLPWIGSGDWNDGLDAIQGESLWMGWFLARCAQAIGELLEKLCKPNHEKYLELARRAGREADKAFDGGFYPRGFLTEGGRLGGEERIDSLPQSWAVISGFAAPEKSEAALNAALGRLLDREHSLVKLFDPPFSPDEPYPGYISSYGEGFRENGGQYTHGAIWLAMACFMSRRADEGWEILKMLLPESHDLARYQAEPFVLAADVYSAPGRQGEAGWTWYTGSAGWYFRVVTEHMLGLKLRGGVLYVEPCLPRALPSYEAEWTDYAGQKHSISVLGDDITVDGRPYLGQAIGGNEN